MFPSLTMYTQVRTLRTCSYVPETQSHSSIVLCKHFNKWAWAITKTLCLNVLQAIRSSCPFYILVTDYVLLIYMVIRILSVSLSLSLSLFLSLCLSLFPPFSLFAHPSLSNSLSHLSPLNPLSHALSSSPSTLSLVASPCPSLSLSPYLSISHSLTPNLAHVLVLA